MRENKLQTELSNKQKLYKDIFLKAQEALVSKLNSIQGKQEKLDFLNNTVSKDILRKINNIRLKSGEIKCARCGACCRVATSEFNYEELKEKAQNGDFFAKSFTSVFVPHEDKNAAKSEFPDYVNLLKEKELFEEINFYYCPKLKSASGVYSARPADCGAGAEPSNGDVGRRGVEQSRPQEQKSASDGPFCCGDYENRPQVCRDFPNNPLVILPPKCSYGSWKDENEVEALFLNAMIELVGYFANELDKP